MSAKVLKIPIEGMAVGGAGVGRYNGLVVFVPYTVTGDLVKARVIKRKRNYLMAEVTELIEASSHRTSPPCPYFGLCGGCQWQHIIYQAQLELKKNIVEQAIQRIAGIAQFNLNPTTPSPLQYFYRNKMEFTFSPKWPITQGERAPCLLGLHTRGSYLKVIDLPRCLLINEGTEEILTFFRELVNSKQFSCYNTKTHDGLMRFLVLRYSFLEETFLVNVVTKDESELLNKELLSLCKLSKISGVINTINPRLAATAIGDKENIIFGKEVLCEAICNSKFIISPSSFFQVNTKCTELLYNYIASLIDDDCEILADFYCGCGSIGLFLSNKVGKVVGVDCNPVSIKQARENAVINNVSNAYFICCMVEDCAVDLLGPNVTVVLDPPRAGLHKKVLNALLEKQPKRLIYVSCNPATLARDLSILFGSYDPVEIQPVDMFPQTAHVEVVVALRRRKD